MKKLLLRVFSCPLPAALEELLLRLKETSMTLAQLRYFCTAARFHSITQAANNLMVTQPTVSIAIRELEREFSLVLFHHSGSRLTLTEEGEEFYRKATQILSDCEDLKLEYSGKDNIRSRVRLGIPPLLSTIFFPELLDSFHVDHPETWLELHEYGSIRACQLVQDEVLDIGLANLELPDIDKYNTRILLEDPLVFCVGPNHPMAGMKSLDLAALDHERVILLNRDSVQNQILQARFSSLDITPQVVMHSSQITTILSFLRQGRCGCFFYASMLPLFPELVSSPLETESRTRIGLVWKKGRYQNKGMRDFLSFCQSYYPGI